MQNVFVAGHATGTPSPGGYAYRIMQGTNVIISGDRGLARTTVTHATLTGVREALRELARGAHAQIITADQTAEALLSGRYAPQHPDLRQLCAEIHQITVHSALTVDVMHTEPSTVTQLADTARDAQQASVRAWSTANSPACPRCRSQMSIQNGRWHCTDENCTVTLRVYETRTM